MDSVAVDLQYVRITLATVNKCHPKLELKYSAGTHFSSHVHTNQSLNATCTQMFIFIVLLFCCQPAPTNFLQNHANGQKSVQEYAGRLNGWNDSGNYPVMTQQLDRDI